MGIGVRRSRWSVVALACAMTFASGGATGQALPTTPIVLSGQATPVAGTTYSRFGGASINPSGLLAFEGVLAGPGIGEVNDSAAFIGAPSSGGFQLLAREGDGAPVATAGDTFGDLNLTGNALTSDGHTMFSTQLRRAGGGSSGYAFFAGAPGDLRLVYRPAINQAILGMPVLNAGPRALLWTQGQSQLIHWNGNTSAPVETPGEIFQPTMNRGGRIAFTAYNTEDRPSGLYAGTIGDFRPVAVRGAPAPGLPAGYAFDLPLNASQNNAGQLAFLASAHSDSPGSLTWGLWAGQPGDLRLLAQDGQQAPGMPAGYHFERILWDIDSPTTPAIGASGHVPFWGHYQNADRSDVGTGAWLARPGEAPRLLARTGDFLSLPDGAGDVALGFFYHDGMWVNGQGQVVLHAQAPSGGDVGTGETLFAALPDGQLRVIVRQGSLFEVAPGDVRLVSDFFLVPGNGGEDGRASPFNDLSQLVYRVDFRDGSSGLFVTTVPEPAAAMLAAIAGVVLLARRPVRL